MKKTRIGLISLVLLLAVLMGAVSAFALDYPGKDRWTSTDNVLGERPIDAMGGNASFDPDAFIDSELAAGMIENMSVFLDYTDEMDQDILDYWDSLGMVKQMHNADVNNGNDRWASYTPKEALEPGYSEKLPLVIVMHGNGNSLLMAESYGYAKLGASENFITVCPEYQYGGSTHPENITAVLDALDEEGLPVDESRIYLVGFSMGGMTTMNYALENPELFAAIAPGGIGLSFGVNATEEACLAASAYSLSTVILAGIMDSAYPYNNASRQALANWGLINGIAIDPTGVGDSIEEQKLGVTAHSTSTVYYDADYYIADYFDDSGENLTRIVGIEGLPHWPSGAFAQAAWDYMSQFQRNADGTISTVLTERDLDERTIGGASVYTLDYMGSHTYADRFPVTVPVYFIYGDGNYTGAGAAKLLNDLGIDEHLREYKGTAYVVSPLDGSAFGDDDVDVFYDLFSANRNYFYTNAKVIGVGTGADFVNNTLSRSSWAVAGIMTYGGSVDGGLQADMPVPAYVAESADGVAEYYIAANGATAETVEDGLRVCYNPAEPLQRVVSGRAQTLEEAFAEAWESVFSRNYRMHNYTKTWYLLGHVTEVTEPYELFPYPMFDRLNLHYNPVIGQVDDTGNSYLWHEYVPYSVDSAGAGTVPLVILLHGNNNDNQTQGETSGLVELAAEHGFLCVAAEWQSRGDGHVAMGEAGVMRLVEYLQEKYPQIDSTRIYMQGLSAGANNTLVWGMRHADVFAAVAGTAAPFGSQSDVDWAEANRREDVQLPMYYMAGDKDEYRVIPAGSTFNYIRAYQAFNGMAVSEAPDFSLNEYYGIALEDQRWITAGTRQVLIGGLSDESGVQLIRLAGIADYGHWNYVPMAEDIWAFLSQFRRNADGTLGIVEPDTEAPELPEKPVGERPGAEVATYTITSTAGEGGSISPSGAVSVSHGSSRTFTIRANTGYVIDDVLVDGESVGAESTYTFRDVQADGTIHATFSREAGGGGDALPFGDVTRNNWYYEAVAYVYENGLMVGTSATEFAPLETTSRAMVVTTLWRMAGEPSASGDTGFTDLTGSWYREAVAWAVENGIVNGYSPTAFGPDDDLTREQMAALFYRYARHMGADVSAAADLIGYTDAGEIHSWALTEMRWANAVELITGRTATTLVPDGTGNRAELATVLMRLDGLLAD